MKIKSVHPQMYNQTVFKGRAKEAPRRWISDANAAIAQWEVMKHPQYSEIYQEEEIGITSDMSKKNKEIRMSNYSFLDELKSKRNMAQFIEHFKKVTGFPVLEDSSRKIREEFSRVLKTANANLYTRYRDFSYSWFTLDKEERERQADKTILSGYDRFCSVGLDTALPGSDLDKGFAIIEGVEGGYQEQKSFADMFKGEIWNNIDNRIMSVNHTAAFPNIATDKQLIADLEKVDRYAQEFVNPQNINAYRYLRMINGNPISGSKFNIFLSERIPDIASKYEAKNLAYLIETIRDGRLLDFNQLKAGRIERAMDNSYFGHCSNITQSYKMQQYYDEADKDIVKKKLKARQEMERKFEHLPIREQYEVVKEVIRSMSGDNKTTEYQDMFFSPADKHRLLINDILRGKIHCSFEQLPNNAERTHLFFVDPETIPKYYNLNVYDTNI